MVCCSDDDFGERENEKEFLCLDTNIDEVLNLTDPSLIPDSFINEIQHDQIYATIFEELQKKFARFRAPNLSQEEKPLSPHLFALQSRGEGEENDDDDLSGTDDLTSSASSEPNDLPANDEYDTDIEQGRAIHLTSLLSSTYS